MKKDYWYRMRSIYKPMMDKLYQGTLIEQIMMKCYEYMDAKMNGEQIEVSIDDPAAQMILTLMIADIDDSIQGRNGQRQGGINSGRVRREKSTNRVPDG